MVLITPNQINEIKFYLKQIEDEMIEMADRIKLDSQRRVGLETKFTNANKILDDILKTETPVTLPTKEAKVDAKSGIKKLS